MFFSQRMSPLLPAPPPASDPHHSHTPFFSHTGHNCLKSKLHCFWFLHGSPHPGPPFGPQVIDLQGDSKCVLVYGQMNEPPGARARVAQTALTMAEYFRDEAGQGHAVA